MNNAFYLIWKALLVLESQIFLSPPSPPFPLSAMEQGDGQK